MARQLYAIYKTKTMILQMNCIPGNMIAFRAMEDITKADFEQVVLPAVEALVAERGELNYLLEVDTLQKADVLGAWWKEMIEKLPVVTNRVRAAIVSDAPGLSLFQQIFAPKISGQFRSYQVSEVNAAVEWVRGRD